MVKEFLAGYRLRWILIAIIAFLGGYYVLSGGFNGFSDSQVENGDSSSVLIANQYIPAFTVLKPGMAAIRTFPKGFMPPGSLHALEDLSDEGRGPAFMASVAIPEGQPLTRTVISELGKSHGMSSLLNAGKVAVSFSVDAVRGVGVWLQPGDIIAIYETARAESAGVSSRKTTRLLFSSVKILAVDRKRLGTFQKSERSGEASGESDAGGNVLTVLLNPVEAAKLVAAREAGHLSVLLRPLGDDMPWAQTQEDPS